MARRLRDCFHMSQETCTFASLPGWLTALQCPSGAREAEACLQGEASSILHTQGRKGACQGALSAQLRGYGPRNIKGYFLLQVA